MGSPEDPSNFINAVIDEKAFDRIAKYIDYVKEQSDAEIIVGGGYNKSKGYFIEPTIVLTSNPKFKTLCEEIFGPVITIYVYEPKDWNALLNWWTIQVNMRLQVLFSLLTDMLLKKPLKL